MTEPRYVSQWDSTYQIFLQKNLAPIRGLYRHDGLGCFQNLSAPESEKVKKKLYKIFKQSGLSITAECNLQIADFLDVTFDLRTDKYYPYRKDNNQLLYINKQSNHPPTIIKQISSMVSRRISDISCNKEYFDKAAPAYNNALKFSSFNENIQFKSTPHQEGIVIEKLYGSIHDIVSM